MPPPTQEPWKPPTSHQLLPNKQRSVTYIKPPNRHQLTQHPQEQLQRKDQHGTASPSSLSDTRVKLWVRVLVGEVVVPGRALGVQHVDVGLVHAGAVVAHPLEEGHAQPARDVPRDMAVHALHGVPESAETVHHA